MMIDAAYIVFAIVICAVMTFLFLKMLSHALPGKGKYLLTPAWMFRADLFTLEGRSYRNVLLVLMATFTAVSAWYFWR